MWKGFFLAIFMMVLAGVSCVGGCMVGASAVQKAGCPVEPVLPPPPKTVRA